MADATRSMDKRFLRAARGLTCDRPPFWFMRQAGRYLPEYREIRSQAGSFLDLCYAPELACEVTLQPLRRFRMDAAILFSDILIVPNGLGVALDYVEGEGPRLARVTCAADIPVFDADRFDSVVSPVYETVRRVAQALSPDVALIGFAGSPWTVATYMVEGGGSRDFATVKDWSFRDPDGFAVLIDRISAATIHYLTKQVEAGAEAIQLFDTWAGALPPEGFDRWVIEPTHRIVKALRTLHPTIPILGFPRGAGTRLRHYRAQTGVDVLSLDSTVDLETAALLQREGPVQGNLDPMLLAAGGPALDAAAERRLHTLGSGPYIFNLGHGIIPQTPPDHVGRLAALINGAAR